MSTNTSTDLTNERRSNQTSIERQQENAIQINEPSQSEASGWTYRPSVDIFETDDKLLLIADLPGSTSDGIDVSLEAGVLTIQAEIESRAFNGRNRIMQEYGVGNFHRRFEIDESIDAQKVTADYRDGSLTVHLPKDPKTRRRRIPITA